MKQILLLSLLISLSSTGWCQSDPSQQTLVWSYNKLYNGKNQQELQSDGQLISYPGQKVDWVQANYTDSYTITSTTGSWPDVTTTGSIQFNVQWGNASGTVTFTKDSNGMIAELNLVNPGRPNSYFKFYITSVTTQ